MRKHIQKQLIELVDSVLEGVDYAFSKKEQAESAQQMLQECYFAVNFINENISKTLPKEKTDGYGINIGEIQDCLENFNEAIFSKSNIDSCYKLVKEKVNGLKDKITKEKIKLEILFCPYKASMWDSLESIWMAAKDDENCNALVMPIPYFDRNPDMTMGQMHYEGFDYPEYVPVIDWTKYDLSVNKPDVIYIHNPYDDNNRVTSVHPMFYSSELKKYTDCLVYVPYFVLGDFKPDNQEAIDNMKHFITTPGVVNADKVIVQSENMRQVYINELVKCTNENHRGYWENKILGIGSPKFDKVVNTKKEELNIPSEWLKIIKKDDGTYKKVIFYNTSIGALLANREKYIDKIKYVFDVFKENKNDVTLLWRPHPLLGTTIQSMLPYLYEQYMKLVNDYKSEGWGIYDDTSDLDRAIMMSDAYYGDHSSVVQLCQNVDMLIMIQDF